MPGRMGIPDESIRSQNALAGQMICRVGPALSRFTQRSTRPNIGCLEISLGGPCDTSMTDEASIKVREIQTWSYADNGVGAQLRGGLSPPPMSQPLPTSEAIGALTHNSTPAAIPTPSSSGCICTTTRHPTAQLAVLRYNQRQADFASDMRIPLPRCQNIAPNERPATSLTVAPLVLEIT